MTEVTNVDVVDTPRKLRKRTKDTPTPIELYDESAASTSGEESSPLEKAKILSREQTIWFLHSYYDFCIAVCCLTVILLVIYLKIVGATIETVDLLTERVFIVTGIGISSLFVLLLCTLRQHWPVNVLCMQLLQVWTGVIAGFVLCTHIKLLNATLNPTSSQST